MDTTERSGMGTSKGYPKKRLNVNQKSVVAKKPWYLKGVVIIVAILIIALVAVFFLFGKGLLANFNSDSSSEKTSIFQLSLPSDGESFRLNGANEQTIMIRSHYIEEGTSAGLDGVTVTGFVDTEVAGDYVLTYELGREKLTRTVRVVDDRQMVMNLNGTQATMVRQGQPYVESGCNVICKTDGNLKTAVEVSGTVDTAVPGEYQGLYKAVNSQGVICAKKRTVSVVPDNEFVANTEGVPVLMYHYVYSEADEPFDKADKNNWIKNSAFEEHLKHLTESNYYFPSYQELSAYVKGEIDLPEKSAVLTFDDGQEGFLKLGIPLLEQYKVPATSFIVGVDSDASEKISTYASEYVTFQSHSFDMHRAGGNVGHGGVISALREEEIVEDLLKAKEVVHNGEAFAYPFGDNTETAHQAVLKADILCSFTTQYGKVQKGADCSHLPRVRVVGNLDVAGFRGSL